MRWAVSNAPRRASEARDAANGPPVLVRARGELAQAEMLPDQPPCPICGGSGRVIGWRDNVRTVGRCRCQQLPDRIGRFNRAGVPARHAASTLTSFALGMGRSEGATKAYTEIIRWKSRFEKALQGEETWPGLLLHGSVGRGKTHLMVGLVRWMVLELGIEVRFVEFTRLLTLLREGYDKGQSDRSLLNELVAVPVLAIDELGKGRLTDWELSVVDELISRRYDAMACTLGTSNYPPGVPAGRPLANLAEGARMTQTLGDRVGDRVYSRLRDMVEFIEVGGLDYRLLGTDAR